MMAGYRLVEGYKNYMFCNHIRDGEVDKGSCYGSIT